MTPDVCTFSRSTLPPASSDALAFAIPVHHRAVSGSATSKHAWVENKLHLPRQPRRQTSLILTQTSSAHASYRAPDDPLMSLEPK